MIIWGGGGIIGDYLFNEREGRLSYFGGFTLVQLKNREYTFAKPYFNFCTFPNVAFLPIQAAFSRLQFDARVGT